MSHHNLKTMKLLIIVGVLSVLYGCDSIKEAVVIDLPNVPAISICKNVANEGDVALMKSKIAIENYKQERLDRGLLVTRDYCFVSAQVIQIMDSYIYDDSKLEIAKELYDQTTDKSNYDTVVDALTYKSNKDKLKTYIANHP